MEATLNRKRNSLQKLVDKVNIKPAAPMSRSAKNWPAGPVERGVAFFHRAQGVETQKFRMRGFIQGP